MLFLQKTSDLLHISTASTVKEEVNARLIGSCDKRPDHARHIIYKPMPSAVITHLQQSYKGIVPVQLLHIYREMNGADLFWTTRYLQRAKLHIPTCMLSIYGVPCSDSRMNIEPFNISVEDLLRPKNTPTSWLKFCSYCEPTDLQGKLDLYVNTEDGQVYSMARESNACDTIHSWTTIDSCLCEIFDKLAEISIP